MYDIKYIIIKIYIIFVINKRHNGLAYLLYVDVKKKDIVDGNRTPFHAFCLKIVTQWIPYSMKALITVSRAHQSIRQQIFFIDKMGGHRNQIIYLSAQYPAHRQKNNFRCKWVFDGCEMRGGKKYDCGTAF